MRSIALAAGRGIGTRERKFVASRFSTVRHRASDGQAKAFVGATAASGM
jgi:hypothetical protein